MNATNTAKFVCRKVRAHLDATGMPYVDACKIVGVTEASMSRIYNSQQQNMHLSTIVGLCKLLKCTPNELMGIS